MHSIVSQQIHTATVPDIFPSPALKSDASSRPFCLRGFVLYLGFADLCFARFAGCFENSGFEHIVSCLQIVNFWICPFFENLSLFLQVWRVTGLRSDPFHNTVLI